MKLIPIVYKVTLPSLQMKNEDRWTVLFQSENGMYVYPDREAPKPGKVK